MSTLCTLFGHQMPAGQPTEKNIYQDDEWWWAKQLCPRCHQLVQYPFAMREKTMAGDCGHLFYGLVVLRDDYEGYRGAYRTTSAFFNPETIHELSCSSKELTDRIKRSRGRVANKRSNYFTGTIGRGIRKISQTLQRGHTV